MSFNRGNEVFGRRNEVRHHNFIPPVKAFEKFTEGPYAINFVDVEGGSWIDYRPQFSTAPQDVPSVVLPHALLHSPPSLNMLYTIRC
jgi:hypothetical protein